jgi:hypothetical protein
MLSIGRRTGITLSVLTVAIVILTAILASSYQTSAGDGVKVVRGWVWDNAGRNVTDASVVVTVWEDDTKTNQRSTDSELTDADGFYSLQFGPSDWYVGDYIEVVCTYEGDQDWNFTYAVSSLVAPFQYVNITYDFEIPEFGSLIGLILAGGAIGAVAMVALVANQRKRVKN